MSRYVKISDSNYKLSVLENGTVTLDVGGHGNVLVTGNLSVAGSLSLQSWGNILANTLSVIDNKITLGSTNLPTDVTANLGGMVLKGSTDKTILWNSGYWKSSENFSLNSGKSYYINGTSVLSSTTLGSTVVTSSLTSVGTITSGTWSGSFGAVSGANLTSLTAGNLTGTIPSAVLGNSTTYVGTTAVALNRSSANLALAGISSVTLPGSNSGTIQIIPTAIAGTSVLTLPAITGTVITSGDTGTVTSTMIADGTIVNGDISSSAAIAVSKLAANTISGVTLGNALNTLTLGVSGNGLSGSASYNGSSNVTFTVTSNATNNNTASTIVSRDINGNFSAGTITAALTGNSSTSTALATGRTIGMTGDVTWTSASFNGTTDVTGVSTLANSGVTAGTYNSSTQHVPFTVDSKGRITSVGTLTTITPAWSSITSIPTTISGYGITDAQSKNANLTSISGLSTSTTGLIKMTNGVASLDSSAYITGNQSITVSGDATGSGATAISLTLANSGVTAGTYNSSTQHVPFTVDSKGRITSVGSLTTITPTWSSITSTPTTISGYGITDAYTKTQIDGFLQGLDPKASVVAGTTANITLSGTQTIDGIAVVAGDRVLVKNQTNTFDNGIYIVAAGSWSRATDMDAWSEITGAYTFVEKGSTLADSGWVCTADQGGILGTTAITWVQFAGAGSVTAGTGISVSGNTVSLASGVATAGTYNSVTVDTYGRVTTGTNPTTLAGYGITDALPSVGSTSLTTTGTVTTGTWSGSFGAVSGANLTNLSAGNLSGTIPSAVLGNSTTYVGTTAVALNRSSANLALTGISSITLPGSNSGTIQIIPTAIAGTGTIITLPASTGTVALTSNTLSAFAATTSAQLASVLSDETGTGSVVFANTPTLVSPILGTPTSGTLTNCTGLPISGIASLGTGVGTWLGTPSSANLAAAITDETGTGALVFATSPTLVTPILGTPTSGTLTSCTGLPIIGGTTGTLSVARGGTGVATLTGFVYGNGTGAFTASTSINSAAIGNTTPSTGAFTTLSASGNTTITSTTASTSSSNGALVVTGGLGIGGDVYTGGNLTISGNFTVNGTTTTVSSTNLELTDSLIYLATGNSANSVDIGFVGHFNNGLYQHTGLARHAINNSWYLFSGMTTEPSTVITPSDATFAIDTLRANVIGTIGVGTQNSGAFTSLTSNTSLVGTSANFTRFPNALSVVSNTAAGIQQNESHNIGLIAEGTASNTLNTVYGIGIYGVGYTSSITRCGGVVGEGHVSASADVGSAVGVRGYSNDVHAGGLNIGLYGDAANGSSSYGLYINNGDIYTATAKNWVMNGNISFTGAYSVTIPTLSLTNALSISSGGTGLTTVGTNGQVLMSTGTTMTWGSVSGLGLPAQTGNGGKYLKTDGTTASWDALDISTNDISGILPIANGGTGASSASAARTALSAAASGANSDITSLTGLTTALGITYGGTGLTAVGTNGQILTSNGTAMVWTAAPSGLPAQTGNGGKYLKTDGTTTSWDALDISTNDISGILPIANGGTGASSASAARTALSAAASGANSDITSLTGLTTALGVSYGGTGVTTSTGTGSVVLNTTPTFTTSILTGSTTFSLLNTTATTVSAFGAATTLTIGGATTAQTVNIASGAIVSGNTKTVNIGNGGASGSTTIVNIGSSSNSTINLNGTIVYQNASTSLTSEGVGQTVLATVTQTAVDTWSSSVYRSAEYTVQVTQGTTYYMTKISLIHDGTNVYMTEYGTVDTAGILASFDANISTGNVQLLITMANAASATVNLKRSVIVI